MNSSNHVKLKIDNNCTCTILFPWWCMSFSCLSLLLPALCITLCTIWNSLPSLYQWGTLFDLVKDWRRRKPRIVVSFYIYLSIIRRCSWDSAPCFSAFNRSITSYSAVTGSLFLVALLLSCWLGIQKKLRSWQRILLSIDCEYRICVWRWRYWLGIQKEIAFAENLEEPAQRIHSSLISWDHHCRQLHLGEHMVPFIYLSWWQMLMNTASILFSYLSVWGTTADMLLESTLANSTSDIIWVWWQRTFLSVQNCKQTKWYHHNKRCCSCKEKWMAYPP